MVKVKASAGAAKATRGTKRAAPRKKAVSKSNEPEIETMSPAFQDAFYLSEAAVMLDQARTGARRNKKKLATALIRELEVWAAIRTAALYWTGSEKDVIKKNIFYLSEFISKTIISSGVDISDSEIDTLININLQISEGFLEGLANQKVREKAYSLWEKEGCPQGRDQEHWRQAQQETLGG